MQAETSSPTIPLTASRSGTHISDWFRQRRRPTCSMATSTFLLRPVTLSLRSPCIRSTVVLLVLSTAALTLLGQTTGPAKPPATNAEAVARGQAQFRKSCAFCHGPDATGGTEGPNLTMSSAVRHDKNGDLIGNIIREGRPAKGMPPIALQQSDIADVVNYLHARISELDRRSAGKPPSTYSLNRLLTGNADTGKRFFDDQCSRCHSPSGNLAHIAKKYAPVELQSRFLYPSDVKRIAEIQLGSGAHATGELAYIDAFTVAIHDGQGFFHSWPLESVSVEIRDPLTAHRELL